MENSSLSKPTEFKENNSQTLTHQIIISVCSSLVILFGLTLLLSTIIGIYLEYYIFYYFIIFNVKSLISIPAALLGIIGAISKNKIAIFLVTKKFLTQN
jgi:ABC-type phosphate transport system permease subunit